MVKRKHVVQVQAEPAAQVSRVKKPVKKQTDPSDPEAPLSKDHTEHESAIDFSD